MSRPFRLRGFTLIEILVVVVLVGIIAVAAVLALSTRSDDRELEQQARRLAALLELASAEAVMQGRELALEIDARGYRFHAWAPEDGQWHPLQGDYHLGERTLPEGMSVALQLEGRTADLAQREPDTPRPQVMLASSGEITPFRMQLARHVVEGGVVIEADARGIVSVSRLEPRR